MRRWAWRRGKIDRWLPGGSVWCVALIRVGLALRGWQLARFSDQRQGARLHALAIP